MAPPDEMAERWRPWLGRAESASERVGPLRAQALQATLDASGPPLAEGDALPPLWHWCYFWNLAPGAELGPDGHAARGGFLPPIELPRRMWAGSRFRFERPLVIGATVTRRSTIAKIEEKTGRSGRLVFVTVAHEYRDADGICLHEEHDIVYREASPAGAAAQSGPGTRAPEAADFRRLLSTDPVLLFRYSALTFNGHRIHYDALYAREREGYPGLVVHGPLQATLMLGTALAHTSATLRAFEFTARRPLFVDQPFTVAGRRMQDGATQLWIADRDGRLAMQGQAELDTREALRIE